MTLKILYKPTLNVNKLNMLSKTNWVTKTIISTKCYFRRNHNGFHYGLTYIKWKNNYLCGSRQTLKECSFSPNEHTHLNSYSRANIYMKHYQTTWISKKTLFQIKTIFMSALWEELFKLIETTLSHSSLYHPQAIIQAKVTNRTL